VVVPSPIRAQGLSKRYGRERGVLDLDFAVQSGEVFAFLGPNGAGKTTTIRLILDLIRPTRGTIEVFGHDPRHDVSLRRRIGYLPGDLRLYERLSPRELCVYFAHLRGLRGLRGAGRAAEIASLLELPFERPIGSLSKGNRQKTGIVQAFMHDPDLLVLDEPTAGLDPLVQQVFYRLLADARERGATVFLSSHVLPEVQHVADRVAVVRDGKLVLVEGVDELRARASTRLEATFASAPPRQAFAGIKTAEEIDRHGRTVLFAVHGEIDPLIKALARYRVTAIDSHEADLEDIFLTLYRDGEERHAA
jgi:beta-exotoxin I transport system ATP-binding protein